MINLGKCITNILLYFHICTRGNYLKNVLLNDALNIFYLHASARRHTHTHTISVAISTKGSGTPTTRPLRKARNLIFTGLPGGVKKYSLLFDQNQSLCRKRCHDS